MRGNKNMKKSYVCAATAIFFWSTVAVAAKLLLGSLNNFQVLWASAFFAFIFLVLLNIINGNIKKLKTYKLRDYLITALIGLPGTFFYYVFYKPCKAKYNTRLHAMFCIFTYTRFWRVKFYHWQLRRLCCKTF